MLPQRGGSYTGSVFTEKEHRDLLAFALEVRDVPDHELPKYRDRLFAWNWRLKGREDMLEKEPWVRVPRKFFADIWPHLTAGEQRVMGALWGLVDSKTLQTFAGLRRIAQRAGLSEGQASRALTALKKRGLIARWRQQHKQWRSYFTRILPRRCFKDPKEAEVLRSAAAPREYWGI
jgi:hypothetical protein